MLVPQEHQLELRELSIEDGIIVLSLQPPASQMLSSPCMRAHRMNGLFEAVSIVLNPRRVECGFHWLTEPRMGKNLFRQPHLIFLRS